MTILCFRTQNWKENLCTAENGVKMVESVEALGWSRRRSTSTDVSLTYRNAITGAISILARRPTSTKLNSLRLSTKQMKLPIVSRLLSRRNVSERIFSSLYLFGSGGERSHEPRVHNITTNTASHRFSPRLKERERESERGRVGREGGDKATRVRRFRFKVTGAGSEIRVRARAASKGREREWWTRGESPGPVDAGKRPLSFHFSGHGAAPSLALRQPPLFSHSLPAAISNVFSFFFFFFLTRSWRSRPCIFHVLQIIVFYIIIFVISSYYYLLYYLYLYFIFYSFMLQYLLYCYL